jgi:hypothetical protein
MNNKIDYTGKVYVYSSGMTKDLISLSIEKLSEYGVNKSDVIIIDLPEGVPKEVLW